MPIIDPEYQPPCRDCGVLLIPLGLQALQGTYVTSCRSCAARRYAETITRVKIRWGR